MLQVQQLESEKLDVGIERKDRSQTAYYMYENDTKGNMHMYCRKRQASYFG